MLDHRVKTLRGILQEYVESFPARVLAAGVLEIHPTALTRMLSGERGVTWPVARRLMDLYPTEQNAIIAAWNRQEMDRMKQRRRKERTP